MLPAKSTEIRSLLLQAATRLFARHGFEGASLEDIASAVGIRKPSLLYHFSSKEELHQAVLDELLARWNEALPQVLVAATAGEDQFDAIMREIVSFFRADPDRARLLIREGLDRPEEIRGRLVAYLQPVMTNLAGRIRKGQQTGVLRGDVDPEAYLFEMVVLLLSGMAMNDRFAPLLPKSARYGSPSDRLSRELSRISKASLFSPASREARAARSRSSSARRAKTKTYRGATSKTAMR